MVNRAAIPEPVRLEKTNGAILPYRWAIIVVAPVKNSCRLTACNAKNIRPSIPPTDILGFLLSMSDSVPVINHLDLAP